MPTFAFVVACSFATVAVGADEINPPKSACGPVHGLATAKVENKRLSITIRVLQIVPEVSQQKVTEFQEVKKTVNGQEVIEKVPVEKVVTVQRLVVQGFREVKVIGKDVKVQDATGKSILLGQLPKLLAKETPVLLNTCAEPVDAFYLATVKEGTLIISIEPKKLFGPSP